MLKLNDKNVLVTGAAGKLGNYVSEYLHKKGYNVTCTDVVLPKPDSRIAKLKLPFVKGDLLDLGDIMKAIAMAQCGTIVHLGAIPFNVELQPPYDTTPKKGPSCGGVRSNYVMPEDNAMKINTMGTFYVMDAARRMGVKNVIAASSYYCYGLGMRISGVPFKPDYLPIDEKHPCTPEDTYSLSKHLGDEIMEAFCRAYDMNGIAMRLMGVYLSLIHISVKCGEGAFQLLTAGEVEMVGGFVQHEGVALFRHEDGETQPRPFPARQDGYFFITVIPGEEHLPQEAAHRVLRQPRETAPQLFQRGVFRVHLFVFLVVVSGGHSAAPANFSLLRKKPQNGL